jgi:hypothetical protein
MKSSTNVSNKIFGGLFAALLGLCPFSAAHAQIFVSNFGGNSIGEYNLDGTAINASLILGLNDPQDIAISGSRLFVTNLDSGTIGEYTTSGTAINPSLVSGLNEPTYLVVETVPEPSAWILMLCVLCLLAFLRICMRRALS